jgi:hypothetical protein
VRRLPGMIDAPLQTMIDEVLPSSRKLYFSAVERYRFLDHLEVDLCSLPYPPCSISIP